MTLRVKDKCSSIASFCSVSVILSTNKILIFIGYILSMSTEYSTVLVLVPNSKAICSSHFEMLI